jgi:hypothetical protein
MRGGHLGLPSFEIPVQKRLLAAGTNLEPACRVGSGEGWHMESAVDTAPGIVKVADLGPAPVAKRPGRARQKRFWVW